MNYCQSCIQPFYIFKISLYFYKYEGASCGEKSNCAALCVQHSHLHFVDTQQDSRNTCIHVFILLAQFQQVSDAFPVQSFAIPSLKICLICTKNSVLIFSFLPDKYSQLQGKKKISHYQNLCYAQSCTNALTVLAQYDKRENEVTQQYTSLLREVYPF